MFVFYKMKFKYLLSMLLLLSSCTVTEQSELQTCKLFIGLNGETQIDQIHHIAQAHFKDTPINGYTIYAGEGAWRPARDKAYITESTAIIEVVLKNLEIVHIHELAVDLEKQLKQMEVMHYCQVVKAEPRQKE